MANISGNLSDNARLIIVDESDWSVESNTEESSGSFEITGLSAGDKTIISRATTGECIGYGNVGAIEVYSPWVSYFNNTYWEPFGGDSQNALWTGTTWTSNGNDVIDLQPKTGSSWVTGFKPTRLRVTGTGWGDLTYVALYGEDDHYLIWDPWDHSWGYPDGMFSIELPLDWTQNTYITNIYFDEAIIVTNIEFYTPANPWESIWDNTKFQASSGSWNGSAWVSESSGYSQWLTLEVKAGENWHVGYRPTKVRATISPTAGSIFSGWDSYMSARWNVTSGYNSLVEIDITWGVQNIYQISLEVPGAGAPQFTLSNIEWYVG